MFCLYVFHALDRNTLNLLVLYHQRGGEVPFTPAPLKSVWSIWQEDNPCRAWDCPHFKKYWFVVVSPVSSVRQVLQLIRQQTLLWFLQLAIRLPRSHHQRVVIKGLAEPLRIAATLRLLPAPLPLTLVVLGPSLFILTRDESKGSRLFHVLTS